MRACTCPRTVTASTARWPVTARAQEEPVVNSRPVVLPDLLDDPREAELQRWLDSAEVPEHLPAVRPWRLAGVDAVAVVCNCGFLRFVASRDLAFTISRLHWQTGEEP